VIGEDFPRPVIFMYQINVAVKCCEMPRNLLLCGLVGNSFLYHCHHHRHPPHHHHYCRQCWCPHHCHYLLLLLLLLLLLRCDLQPSFRFS
jgi:hypothetical protein